jgi:hypothetical protein
MLSGRRKRDYEAEALAGQAGGAAEPAHSADDINDAAASDAAADEATSNEDEPALVLA